ncbi:hypothetical protein M2G96_20975 [Vibrio vulnificus]|uniref:hypothetical protein n=1 Tax=Vibrio TaxID=662 RepID=UPI000A20A724|nr:MULTISPECIES: hypothetical protein [Vibrio]ARN65999.1 hypothetical protein FORC36_1482 [Vibrio vulnificus]MCU8216751.1 hypothetical protein [Vibrio vulnificus]MDC8111360.1 hypothetical protein [Vibrio sp. CCUG 15886]HDY7722286.1 hypothetical protein [Vibrio vulnificus]HDY7749641.1 hypothetical protein [Vibrio vulnificus]
MINTQIRGGILRDKKQNKSSILIACTNNNGNLVRKHISVGTKRIVRKVAGQPFVITPVFQNGTIAGYAIERNEKLRMIAKPLRTEMTVKGRLLPKASHRKVQRYAHDVYELGLLPDGIYICSGCGNYVAPPHVCDVNV